ncbi:MAG: protein kinase [Acidobacteriia bacterium]|nr:protein kinase [Terriglobia bacterium]
MGEVYKARDRRLDRTVVLKVLKTAASSSADLRLRFEREARAIAALSHPHICILHDIGSQEGIDFLVMEYLDGQTLAERLAGGPLQIDQALQFGIQIADALAVAHKQGIIHRDLKPGNVMLTKTGAKLLDFGLAKLKNQGPTGGELQSSLPTQAAATVTQKGTILGTLAYMAPEQLEGKDSDARSDLFAFGAVLYEMLTGALAFEGTSQASIITAIMSSEPPPVSSRQPLTPPALDRLVQRCLAKNPDDRWDSAHDVADELRWITDAGTLPRTARAGLPDRDRTRGRIFRKVAIGAMVATAILAATLGIWYIHQRQITPSRPVSAVSVLVADFVNRTGDAVFDGTLAPAFSVAIEGASFVTCYSQASARRLALQMKPDMTVLDESLARLVAVREGINIVTTGMVAKSGGYEISIKAIDGMTGKAMFVDAIRASNKDMVLASVVKLAARLRRALGEATPESTELARAETFTANSLEAAHDYSMAQELQWSGQYDEAIQWYQKALALDRDLGRAYVGLAAIAANLSHREEAENYLKQAMARIARMSEREKYRTRGIYYLVTRQPDQAVEEFGNLTKSYPADNVGLSNLAIAYLYKRDMARALESGRRAVEIFPKHVLSRANLALYAMYASDFDTAVNESARVLTMNPKYKAAHVCLGLSYLALGQPEQAEAIWAKLAELGPDAASTAALGRADLAIYQGRTADAKSILTKSIDVDMGRKETEDAAHKMAVLATVHLLEGSRGQALMMARQALATSRVDTIMFSAAIVHATARDENAALTIADDLDRRYGPEPQMLARLVRGEVALARRDARAALAQFTDAQRFADSWLGRNGLGRAYLEMGAFPEAQNELEHCLTRRGEACAVFLDEIPTYRILPPIYLLLGRAEDGLASISTVLEMTNASSRIALKSGSRAVLSLESLAISNTYL